MEGFHVEIHEKCCKSSLSLTHACPYTQIFSHSHSICPHLLLLLNQRYSLQLQDRVNSLCVVADDSLFLTLLVAHLSRTTHVISLFPGLRDKGARYLQAIADANGFSMDRVEVLEKRKTYLTMHDTHQKKVIPS